MMNKMVVANLVHRPTRSFIAMSAIALEVTMILMVVALFYGLLNGSKKSQLGVGADLMVMPPGAAGIVGLSGAPIPIKVGDILRRVPHVVSAVPAVWWFTQKPLEIIYGVDLASYDTLPPKFRYLSGGPFQGPYDVIVDDYFAGMNHAKVGDKIEILAHEFRISGIVPHGKGCRKCLPLETMQDLVSAEGRASVFYLKLDDLANADAVEKSIQQIPGMEKYSVRSMPEYLSTMTPDNLPGFDLAKGRDRRGGGGRLFGDLPVDVHGCNGEDARDRNFEVDGRVEVVHRQCGAAGNCAAGDCGDCWGDHH